MAEQTSEQQPGAVTGEGDALDELDAALGGDAAEQGEGQGEEWAPPTREEWEAMQASLEAEKGKLTRARNQAKRLREGRAAPAGQQQGAGEGEGQQAGPDPQLAVWQQRAVRSAAKAQLLERGADADMVDLALARLRSEQIEFDGEDEPILEDWLDEMEERYPKLFAKALAGMPTATGPRQVGRVDQGRAAARPAPPKLSLGEQIIANSEAARIRARRG
jgi:hypothetical protein